MRQFEGLINGKVYTDENEFSRDLLQIDETGNVSVSYRYVTVNDSKECEENVDTKVPNNYVSESQYVKSITNKNDIELDSNLIGKLKLANNKSEINLNVCKKIEDFNNKIEDNLLHINELKSDYKKLEEKMKLINSQIKTLDDANNNYYLHKEYYTNIKNLLDTQVEETKVDSECGCDCACGECKCKENREVLTLKEIYDMTPKEFAKYLNNKKMYNLADLVEYFIKKC